MTINFVKYSLDGDIGERVSPCFSSENHYINNASPFCAKDIIHSCVSDIRSRYNDFVDCGSGWTILGYKFYDLHITETHDFRGKTDVSHIHYSHPSRNKNDSFLRDFES